MSKPKILVQLDSDEHASVFDAVVAVDAGVDHLLSYHGVRPEDVRNLVYGAMFTRGPQDLHQTAIFIGGSDVAAGERLLGQVTDCFFGPMRVSVMLDANGANTTAAAAVLAAARHVPLAGTTATVLAGTGPVGQRVARLLARAGATVHVGSRHLTRAQEVCDQLRQRFPTASLHAKQTANAGETAAAIAPSQIVVAAGAPRVELVSLDALHQAGQVQVAIDLNAVPPTGIGGLEVSDKGQDRGGIRCYGALGVGGTKMKIHKAALRELFASNARVLDAEEIFEIGQQEAG